VNSLHTEKTDETTVKYGTKIAVIILILKDIDNDYFAV